MKLYVRLLSIVLLLAVVLAGLSLSAPATKAQTPYEQEHAALVALYNSTDGAGWRIKWEDLDSDHCTWYGVSCGVGYVTGIILPSNNLTGSIPPELGNLVNLSSLDLSFNDLSDPIPPELGNLVNLRYLYLEGDLNGPIPPELGNLVNLERLYLSGNDLSGPIPPELGNLVNLERLYLSGNDLTGSIPPELGNLINLYRLDIVGTGVSGPIPPELGNLADLEVLRLFHNNLSGPIPPELGNLVNLSALWLYANDPSLCISTPELLAFIETPSLNYTGPTHLCSPPIAAVGGPYSDDEGSEVSFDASASSDPDGDELQYRWDFDNDESWDTDWSPDPVASYTWDDDWTGTAKIEVTDGPKTVSDTADVTIYNVAPSATFANTAAPYLNLPNTVCAGESATFEFTDPYDPSGADRAAGFSYAYDCGAGIFETGGPSFTCPYPAASTFNTRGRIADKDGGFTEYAIKITVLAPAAAADELRTVVESLDLAAGLESSLFAKLEGAMHALQDRNENNDVSAINILQAFINEVEAQRGQGVMDEQADLLIQAAQQIIESIVGD